MANDSAIPVVALGHRGDVADEVRIKLLPECDVVHICTSIPVAKDELPRLIAGDLSVLPSSGYGTNLQREHSERKTPKLIAIGSGYTDEDLKELQQAIGEEAGIKYLKVQKEALEAGGFTVERPSAELIAQNIKGQLANMGQV